MIRRSGVRAYAVVVAAPLLLFAPVLLGLRVLYWGTLEFQFYPWQHLALQALGAGHLPLWDPLLGNGAPLLANYQTAALYPPNWLALMLPLETAQAWLAALHLAWAGVGMVALARLLRLPPLGQIVAGLAFGLSQYLVARVSFLSINATVAWLPWLVYLAEYQVQLGQQGAGRQRRAGAALALALCVGLQLLAGHAQTAWYSALLVAAWCAWRLLARGQAAAARLRTGAWLAVPVLAGTLLAGVQLAPTAELLQQSPRATAAAYDFVMTYSFSPWRLLTLASPDLLGNPARGQFFGYGNYWEDAIYVGLVPLLLALGFAVKSLIAVARRWAARRPTASLAPRSAEQAAETNMAVFLVVLAIVSLVLGLGRNTPVFPFLYAHVPTFNLFQAPTRILIWLVFALALLAGLGAASWRAPRGWALYWTRLGAAGAVAMMVVGLSAWLSSSPATPVGLQIQTLARALALTGLTGFGAAVLSLLHPGDPSRSDTTGSPLLTPSAQARARPDHPTLTRRAQTALARVWPAMVVAFVAADLLFADYGLNPGAPPDLYRRPPTSAQAIRPTLQSHRLLYFPNDDYAVKYGRFVSFQSFGAPHLAEAAREGLLSNVSVLDGLASANNFDPLLSARYVGLMDVISATRSLALLRLMDVAVIASPQPLSLPLIVASPLAGVSFYQVPGTPQRLWTVTAATTVSGAPAAQAALANPSFDPARTVILEVAGGSVDDPPSAWAPSPTAVAFPVNLPQAGWVVLADTSYPGWVAAVDGHAVTVLHADLAFRAVAVPAGSHTVTFDYQPSSLRTGQVLTALGGVLTLGIAFAAALGHRPSTHA